MSIYVNRCQEGMTRYVRICQDMSRYASHLILFAVALLLAWLAGWLASWLVAWLADWLAVCIQLASRRARASSRRVAPGRSCGRIETPDAETVDEAIPI